MSIFKFIAGNEPLKEVVSPHVETKSLNRSTQSGEDLPSFMTNEAEKVAAAAETRRGKIIIYDDINFVDDFEIITEDEPSAAQDYTEKKYFSALTFDGSDKQANQLLDYIKDYLTNATEIELWCGFSTKKEVAEPTKKNLSQLTAADLKEFFNRNNLEKADLLIVCA